MKRMLILTLLIVCLAVSGAFEAHSAVLLAQVAAPAQTAEQTPPATPVAPVSPPEQPQQAPVAPAPDAAAQPITPTPSPVVPPAPSEATSPPGPAAPAAPVPTGAPAQQEKKKEAEPSTVFKGVQSARQPHADFATMALNECVSCHKGEGIGPTHGSFWMKEHRMVAGRTQKNCADCHQQSFCLDCHKGGGIDPDLKTSQYRSNTVPSSHRTDFREIHPLKAFDNRQTCSRCHTARFCSDCHAKFKGEDLRVQSHRRSWSDLRPSAIGPVHSTFNTSQCQTCHPGGLLPKHEWSAEHAREARRNLQACQTCHSDGEICLTCHSARRGLMVNPHPRDWNSVKNRFKKRSNGNTCIKCHDKF